MTNYNPFNCEIDPHASLDELFDCEECSDLLEFKTVSESVDAYDQMLNETYDNLTIAGMYFDTSDALRELDPTAYKCGWIDYMDSLGVDTDLLEDDYKFDRDRL